MLNPVNLGDLSYLNDSDVSLALLFGLVPGLLKAWVAGKLADLSVDLAYRG